MASARNIARWASALDERKGTPVARPVRKAMGLRECCLSEMARLPHVSGRNRARPSVYFHLEGVTRMSRFLAGLVAASAIFVLASCDDETDTEVKAVSPTAPVVISPAAALMNAPVKVKGSSVCASYLRERTKLQGELTAAPDDKLLLKRATALAAVITDACN